jgi:GTP-binding protein HflX
LRAAGGQVLGEKVQRLRQPDPDYFLSLSQIKDLARYRDAKTVLADDDLSARQARNLLRETGLQPLDRSSVILDIFAQRARTRSSQLQVEAAQLEHLRGQLRGMWPHLQRSGGGIGGRGPGEKQLESDRRNLERRLRKIKRELRYWREHEARQRQERLRSGLTRVALWGYTNSGKSTLARALGAKDALPSATVFSTIEPRTRRVALRTHSFLLTDTVGIIRHMPERIMTAFHSTLAEAAESNLLLHVLSGQNWKEELRVGRATLADVGLDDKRRITVVIGQATDLPPEFISLGSDIDPLRRALEEDYRQRSEETELLFPYSEGGGLSALYEESSVLERRDEADGTRVRALLLPERKHLFQPFLI